MKNKSIVIFILFIFSIFNVSGQSNVEETHYKYGESALRKFLEKRLNEEVKKNKLEVCLTSVVFAKFTIGTDGNIKTLTFSEMKGTPQVFRNILSSILLSTNGSWIPKRVSGELQESKAFILPLIYDMEAGCNPKSVSEHNTYKPIPNSTDTALLYILEFEDHVGINNNQLDCIILRPLHLFSIN